MWGAAAASSANSMSQILAVYCLTYDAGEDEEPVIRSGTRIPFCFCVEGIFQQQRNERCKEHCSENAALFDVAADVTLLQGAATEVHYSVNASVEGLCHYLQFMFATVLWETLKEAVSADQVKCLSELNESGGKGHLLLSALLL